jgi:hypothetical protein
MHLRETRNEIIIIMILYNPLLQQHHNNTHQDLKTRVSSHHNKNKGHKKRETVPRSSAQEVCTTRRGHEWKQCGTITPESKTILVRIRLYANNITRNNIQ